MKKLFVILLSLFALHAAKADNDRLIRVDELPQAARQFIELHFAGRQVALAKMETDFLKKSYEVIFADGNQIEFDAKGNWKEIDCKRSSIPTTTVPAAILTYVQTNYPDEKIVKIEKNYKEYEVKLTNRVELTFDLKFNLTDIDH